MLVGDAEIMEALPWACAASGVSAVIAAIKRPPAADVTTSCTAMPITGSDAARKSCCRRDRADRRYRAGPRGLRERPADPRRSCRHWRGRPHARPRLARVNCRRNRWCRRCRRSRACRRSASTPRTRRSWCGRRCGGGRPPPHLLPHQDRRVLGVEADRRQARDRLQRRHHRFRLQFTRASRGLACGRPRQWRQDLRGSAGRSRRPRGPALYRLSARSRRQQDLRAASDPVIGIAVQDVVTSAASGLLIAAMTALTPLAAHAQGSASMTSASPTSMDPLSGDALYADVKRYESFGVHRYGTEGARAALDWLAGRLREAGLTVEQQPFSMERQYFLDSATLTAGGRTVAVLPQWWLPEDKASFELSAPIARDGADAAGKFVRLRLPYDQGAYLNKGHRDAIATALDRNCLLYTSD